MSPLLISKQNLPFQDLGGSSSIQVKINTRQQPPKQASPESERQSQLHPPPGPSAPTPSTPGASGLPAGAPRVKKVHSRLEAKDGPQRCHRWPGQWVSPHLALGPSSSGRPRAPPCPATKAECALQPPSGQLREEAGSEQGSGGPSGSVNWTQRPPRASIPPSPPRPERLKVPGRSGRWWPRGAWLRRLSAAPPGQGAWPG